MFSNRPSLFSELNRYRLSQFEADALTHYIGRVTADLVSDLRGGVMVMQNILTSLWNNGVRFRIVPPGARFKDLPECRSLEEEHSTSAGIYLSHSKLIVIRRNDLTVDWSQNQPFRVVIHEFAHAVWYVLLDKKDRDYVRRLYHEESGERPASSEYRLKNASEFFAEGFVYFVTPAVKSEQERIVPDGIADPSTDHLWHLNPRLLWFLEKRFKGLIDPKLFQLPGDETGAPRFFGYYGNNQLFLPVIYGGVFDDFSDIEIRLVPR